MTFAAELASTPASLEMPQVFDLHGSRWMQILG